jgi:hypothetical protein
LRLHLLPHSSLKRHQLQTHYPSHRMYIP